MNMHCYPNARSRPLWQYIKPSDVFRCPDDRGQKIPPCGGGDCDPDFIPSNYKVVGMSYQYNGERPGAVRRGILVGRTRPPCQPRWPGARRVGCPIRPASS